MSTERKHEVGGKAGAHLCLHRLLLLATSAESDGGAHRRWAPRSTRSSLQHAAGCCRGAAACVRPASGPAARGDDLASPGAAGWRLEPARRSAAAAPTTAAMTAARRPPSQPSCCPNRPEQASAGDRSHRRVDGATSRVRGRISMMRSQTSQKTPLATLSAVARARTPTLCIYNIYYYYYASKQGAREERRASEARGRRRPMYGWNLI